MTSFLCPQHQKKKKPKEITELFDSSMFRDYIDHRKQSLSSHLTPGKVRASSARLEDSVSFCFLYYF